MQSGELNIIADVAGQLNALERLIKKMPQVPFLCVGDLVDRGPNSRGVIDFVRKNGRSLMGNHEHMMIDFFYHSNKYDSGIWMVNGGKETMANYCGDGDSCYLSYEEFRTNSQKDVLWLSGLPMVHEQSGLIVSHAPLRKDKSIQDCISFVEGPFSIRDSILWNRNYPGRREEFQVHGHNSFWGVSWFNGDHDVPTGGGPNSEPPDDSWAVCLDASMEDVLTGMHWPSKKIFQEVY